MSKIWKPSLHVSTIRTVLTPTTSQAKVSSGVAAIAAERQRQIEAEGWTPEHDDDVNRGLELGRAAISYILGVAYTQEPKGRKPGWPWPWDLKWWKPSDRRRNLVKAGALIAAEIDRLDRSEAREGGNNG